MDADGHRRIDCSEFQTLINRKKDMDNKEGHGKVECSMMNIIVFPESPTLIARKTKDTDTKAEFVDIYHIGCAFNLLSIINSGIILGGQNSSKRQTVLFFLLVDPMDKNHKDPDTIDLGAPRLAQYMHNAWKRHQDAVLGRHQSCY